MNFFRIEFVDNFKVKFFLGSCTDYYENMNFQLTFDSEEFSLVVHKNFNFILEILWIETEFGEFFCWKYLFKFCTALTPTPHCSFINLHWLIRLLLIKNLIGYFQKFCRLFHGIQAKFIYESSWYVAHHFNLIHEWGI